MDPRSATMEFISKIFGMIPGGDMLGQFLGPMISNWLVPGGSPLAPWVWPDSNQSPASAYYNWYNSRMTQAWGSGAASRTAQTQAITALTKAMYPELDDTQINARVAATMSNPFSVSGIAYTMLDPYGVNAGMPAMASLATALQTRGGQFDLRGAVLASDIQTALFDGDAGLVMDVVNNRKKYGGLDVGQVAAVGREVLNSSGPGFFTETENGTTFDSTKFREAVQKLSKDIAPWTDIFGKDIPKLLNQLEALTGQSAALQTDSLQSSAHRMLSVMHTTGASIQHIAAYKDAFATALNDPTGRNRSILGVHSISTDAMLGLSNTGLDSMTTQEFQQVGSRFIVGTAQSRLASQYDLAYARWRDTGAGKEFKADDKAAMEAFRAQYNKALAESNGDTTEALLKASGAASMSELDIYRNTKSQLAATKAGSGASIAREDITRTAIADVQSKFSDTFKKVLGRDATTDDVLKYMSMDKSELIAALKPMFGDDATRVATEIQEYGLTALNNQGAGLDWEYQSNALYRQTQQYNIQNKRALERQDMMDTMRKIAPGETGLSAVLQELNRNKNADYKTLIKEYLGANNMAYTLMESYLGGVDREKVTDNDLEVVRDAGQFVMDNYGVLNTTYKDLYSDLTGSDTRKKFEAVRKAAALQKSSKMISKLSTTESAMFREAIAEINPESLSQDEYDAAIRREVSVARIKSFTDRNGVGKDIGVDKDDEVAAINALLTSDTNLQDSKKVREFLEKQQGFSGGDDKEKAEDKETLDKLVKLLVTSSDEREPLIQVIEWLEIIAKGVQEMVLKEQKGGVPPPPTPAQ